MRLKIIAGNLVAVLLVGLAGYFLVKQQLEKQIETRLTEQVANDYRLFKRGFADRGARLSRMIAEQATADEVRVVYGGVDEASRRQRAYEVANGISRWFADATREGRAPDMVAVVDDSGSVVSRDGDPNTMYGTKLATTLGALTPVLAGSNANFDTWAAPQGKVMLSAFAPVRGEHGNVLGAIVVAYDVSSELMSSEALLLGKDTAVAVLLPTGAYGNSASLPSGAASALKSQLYGAKAAETRAQIARPEPSDVWKSDLGGSTYAGVVGNLHGNVGCAVMANVTAAQEATTSGLNMLLILTALAAVICIAYSFIVGSSFLKPLEEIEEGLLAVINGNTQLRLNSDNPELGGLAFRINQLLNVLTGVSEDVDGTGTATAKAFSDQDITDNSSANLGPSSSVAGSGPGVSSGGAEYVDSPEAAAAMMAEPEADYHARVYQEYVTAKRAIGEDVSNVPQDRFIQRLKGNESQQIQKYGCKSVRFLVETRGGQVSMIPVLIR